jgi:hypothetical protein
MSSLLTVAPLTGRQKIIPSYDLVWISVLVKVVFDLDILALT